MKSIVWIRIAIAGAVLPLTLAAAAQTSTQAAEYVPLPDPGYGIYYQDANNTALAATRWGYHDGWMDGRHDRNQGETVQPQEKDRYALPPDHGGHLGISRERYVKTYRDAYMRGYEHGTR